MFGGSGVRPVADLTEQEALRWMADSDKPTLQGLWIGEGFKDVYADYWERTA